MSRSDPLGRRAFLALGSGLVAGLAGCSGPATMYDGTDRVTIAAGEYESYGFDLASPATLDYAVEVVEGGRIDVLVTRRAHADAIENGVLERYAGTASVLGADSTTLEAKLMQGSWVLLLDNSGLVRGASGESDGDSTASGSESGTATAETDHGTAVVEFDYEITQYIPYGSGQE